MFLVAALAVMGGGVVLQAPHALAEAPADVWVNLATGDDAAAGTQEAPYRSLGQGIDAVKDAGGTVHLASGAEAVTLPATTIPGGVTVALESDVTATGAVKIAKDGALTAGSHTLNLTGNPVMTIAAGGYLRDGIYNLNGSFTNDGRVSGTSREALRLTLKGSIERGTYAGGRYEHATIDVTGKGEAGYANAPLRSDDVAWTLKNYWLVPEPLDITNSDLTLTGRYGVSAFSGGTAFITAQAYEHRIINSHVTIDGSRVNVISRLTVKDSTFTVKNSPDGGFNINGGEFYLENSTLRGENISTYPFVGVGRTSNGLFSVSGDSKVETAAANNYDRVGFNKGTYVVTGGSHRVYTGGITGINDRPTNGSTHGDERLTYFMLADPSLTSLDLIDSSGAHYTYPVAQASDDGNKYVWAPAEPVTVQLRDETASYSDGSGGEKTLSAMRGQPLAAAAAVNGKAQAVLGTPSSASGRDFAGWKYDDATGTHDFDPASTPITAAMTIYATWSGQATQAVVNYALNTGSSSDPAPTSVGMKDEDGDAQVPVLSYDTLLARNPGFVREGYSFSYWSTDAAGEHRIEAGDLVSVADGAVPTIYANWAIKTYTLTFSANGGTFAEDSVFKAESTKGNFTLSKDAQGGEVATYTQPVAWGTSIASALRAAKVPTSIQGIAARNYHQLKPTQSCILWWCNDSYEWSTTPEAGENDYLKTSGKVDRNLTLYLPWKLDESVQETRVHDLPLPADLALTGGVESAGMDVPLVRTGDDLTAEGILEVTSIQQQISSFGESVAEGRGKESVGLHDVASTFTATLTLPEGISLPGDLASHVSLTANELFEVTGTKADGRTITVTMELKNKNYERFVDLERDVTAAPSKLTVTVTDLKVTQEASAADSLLLTATGAVTGSFTGIAVAGEIPEEQPSAASILAMPLMSRAAVAAATPGNPHSFDFTWKATQDSTWGKPDPSNPAEIQASVRMPQLMSAASTLGGNMLINAEDSVVEYVDRTDAATWEGTWTGQLATAAIKQQITTLAHEYCEGDPNSATCQEAFAGINLADVRSTFTAAITLPAGVAVPEGLSAEDVALTKNSAFEVSKVEVTGEAAKTVTITMDLAKEYTTFKELFADIAGDGMPATLEVTIAGTSLTANAQPDTPLRATGTVHGVFTGIATANGKARQYDFTWEAVQEDQSKRDASLDPADATTIAASVQIVTPQELSGSFTLPADLTIATSGKDDVTTEHEAVRLVGRGDGYLYDLAGVLDVSSIKAQIEALAQTYCGDTGSPACQEEYKSIVLKGVASHFTATLTLPEGVEAPEDLALAATKDGFFTANDLFRVSKAEKQEGNKIVITLDLVKNGAADQGSYTDFATLLADVSAVPSTLVVTIPDVKVSSEAAANTNLTFTGTVTGDFQGLARKEASANAKHFAFSWAGKQTPEGRDAASTDPDAITLTVNVPTRSIDVTKVWDESADPGFDTSKRPAVTVNLAADGKSAGEPLTLTAAKGWKGGFSGLNKLQADGVTEISYTVTEEVVKDYTSAISGDVEKGFVITNTRKAPDVPVDPGTGDPVDPGTEEPSDPGTGEPSDPGTGNPSDPGTGNPSDPGTGEPSDPSTGQPEEPATGEPVDPVTTEPTDPSTGEPATTEPTQPATGSPSVQPSKPAVAVPGLAKTGAQVAGALLGGTLLVGAGALLLALRRRQS